MDRRLDFAGRQLHIHSNLAMMLASQGGIKRGHDGEHREPYLLFVVFTTARMPVVKHFRRRAISWPETIQRRCDVHVQVCELYRCWICIFSTSTRTTTAAAARLFSSCTSHIISLHYLVLVLFLLVFTCTPDSFELDNWGTWHRC